MSLTLSVSVRPARVFTVLGVVIAFLVLLSVAGQYSRFFLGHGRLLGFVEAFNVDAEANIPTYFSSLLLLGAAVLAGIIASAARRRGAAFVNHWRMLAVILAYVSLDEFASLHENLISPLRTLLGADGLFFYAWVIPALGILLLLGVVYARFFWHLSPRSKVLFAGAALVYVGGGLGVEMIGGLYASQYGVATFNYALITTVEEALEMVGLAILIYALLDYLTMQAGEGRVVLRDEPFIGERVPPSVSAQNSSYRRPLGVGDEGSSQG